MWWVGSEKTGWTDVGSSEYRKLQPYEKRFLGWNLIECEVAVLINVSWVIGVTHVVGVYLWQKARWNLAEWRGVWKPLFALLIEKFFCRLESSSCRLGCSRFGSVVEQWHIHVPHHFNAIRLKVCALLRVCCEAWHYLLLIIHHEECCKCLQYNFFEVLGFLSICCKCAVNTLFFLNVGMSLFTNGLRVIIWITANSLDWVRYAVNACSTISLKS